MPSVLTKNLSTHFVGFFRLQNTQNSLQRNQIRIETNRQKNPVTQKRLSQSQESIHRLYESKIGGSIFYHKSDVNVSKTSFNLNADLNNHMIRNSRNLLRYVARHRGQTGWAKIETFKWKLLILDQIDKEKLPRVIVSSIS